MTILILITGFALSLWAVNAWADKELEDFREFMSKGDDHDDY